VTPQLFDVELWRRSGHYDAYRENMFFSDVEGREFSMKPMNCPSHCVIYGTRATPTASCRCASPTSGGSTATSARASSRLTRVRSFAQDDAHIFCTPEQIGPEVSALFELMFRVYDTFGFARPVIYLSTRPDKAIGDESLWRHAEATLQRCLEALDVAYVLNPGEGAFYGPRSTSSSTTRSGASGSSGRSNSTSTCPSASTCRTPPKTAARSGR